MMSANDYWVNEPHAKARLVRSRGSFVYVLEEPKLSAAEQKLQRKLYSRLEDDIVSDPDLNYDDPARALRILNAEIGRVLSGEPARLVGPVEGLSSALEDWLPGTSLPVTVVILVIGAALALAASLAASSPPLLVAGVSLAAAAVMIGFWGWAGRRSRVVFDKVGNETAEKLKYYAIRDFLGYGLIDGLIRDPNIEDVSCGGWDREIYVYHRGVEYVPTNVVFNRKDLDQFIMRLAYLGGKHISVANPSVDVSLPLGLRGHLCYQKEITPAGSNFQLRKWRERPISITELVGSSTLSAEMAAYLWWMVEHRSSLMVAGITASGKTTLLNAMANFIPETAKVATCEDTAELRLPHRNLTSFVTRGGGIEASGSNAREITLFDLVKNTLRQRPDFVLVGEVRGEEAFALFQSAASGQLALCTVHAGDVWSVLQRLRSPPMNVPAGLIGCINLVAMMKKVTDPNTGLPHRRMTDLVEVLGYDQATGEFRLNPLFVLDASNDSFVRQQPSVLLPPVAVRLGLVPETALAEISGRAEFIEKLVEVGVADAIAAAHLCWLYARDPADASAVLADILMRRVVEPKAKYSDAESAQIMAEVERVFKVLYGARSEENIAEAVKEAFGSPLTFESKFERSIAKYSIINIYERAIARGGRWW